MSSFTPRAWKTQRDPSDEAPVGKFHAHHFVKLNNRPIARTAFIGREQDVAKITALLSEHRLITLVGLGGGRRKGLTPAAGQAAIVEAMAVRTNPRTTP